MIAVLIIGIIFILLLIAVIKNKRKCNHDWELIKQKYKTFYYKRTYECKKCGKKRIIEVRK